MSKPRKKLHCICKGKPDRTHKGTDKQKHIFACPMALHNRKDS